MAAITFTRPQPDITLTLRVTSSDGKMRAATPEDLEAAGYVRAISPSPAVDAHREAEAWRKIDKWLMADTERHSVTIMPEWGGISRWYAAPCMGNPYSTVTPARVIPGRWKHETKPAALEALATWCEAQ